MAEETATTSTYKISKEKIIEILKTNGYMFGMFHTEGLPFDIKFALAAVEGGNTYICYYPGIADKDGYATSITKLDISL